MSCILLQRLVILCKMMAGPCKMTAEPRIMLAATHMLTKDQKGGLRRAPGDPPTPIHSRPFSNFSKCLTYSINDISCSCRGKTTEEDLVFKIFLLIELSSIFKISLGWKFNFSRFFFHLIKLKTSICNVNMNEWKTLARLHK